MQLPIQITFRNMDSSPAVEARVREEAEKLSEFYDGIMGCRVMVEIPHQHRQQGKRFHIRIDLTVPGGEIVVNHEPSLRGSMTTRRASGVWVRNLSQASNEAGLTMNGEQTRSSAGLPNRSRSLRDLAVNLTLCASIHRAGELRRKILSEPNSGWRLCPLRRRDR